MAIPIAALAGGLISDPGQIWHAGDRHKLVADTTAQAKDEVQTIVGNPEGFKTPDAKQAFDKRMESYSTALQETKDQHGTLDVILKWAAGVVEALGLASLAVGSALALAATGVISLSWAPGVNASVYAEANGLAARVGATLRTVVKGFLNMLSKLKTMLSGIKSMSAKRKMIFATLGIFGVTMHDQAISGVASILPIPHKQVTWPTEP
ncbi:hypothetical protein [Actinoallomurus bryophytorum]|nr:hypothetical protein [Actinoallomurus bryophytorum]